MMNATRKDDMKITKYFIKVKNIAYNMAATGSALSNDDLILHVLSELGPNYNSIATYITSQVGVGKMILNEAYAMLLTQEARIEKQAHMLSGMDVKHDFEENFAQNRGFKKGNKSSDRGFGNYNYSPSFDNVEHFGNGYSGGPSNSMLGSKGQLIGYQSDN